MKNIIIKKLALIFLIGFASIVWSCKATKESARQKAKIDKTKVVANNSIQKDNSNNKLTSKTSSSDSTPFIYKRSKSNYTTHLSFQDENNNTVKTIDIYNANKYNKLDYDIYLTRDNIFNNYTLDEPVSTFISDYSEYNKLELLDTARVSYAYSSSYVDTFQQNALIAYTLMLRTSDRTHIGTVSCIDIYDNNGNLIYNLEDIATGIDDPEITSDSKYLLYSYGGIEDETFSPLIDIGYCVYNLQTNTLIIDHKIPSEFFGGGGIWEGNNVIIASFYNANSTFYQVFDLQENVYYEQIFPNELVSKLKEINKQGFVFGNSSFNDSNTYIKTYMQDFTLKEIKQ